MEVSQIDLLSQKLLQTVVEQLLLFPVVGTVETENILPEKFWNQLFHLQRAFYYRVKVT